MITDGKKWHYFWQKKLFALLRETSWKHDDDYCCVNCLHSFRIENKLKSHENICKNHGYCYIKMSEKDKNILKYNHVENSIMKK